jgi:hypothetical protein
MTGTRALVALAVGTVTGAALLGSARAQGLVATASASAGAVGDHEVLVESLQSRLDVLAGRVGRLEDRVGLLRETALGGRIAETRAVIVHKNELGSAFELERARYVLDGGILLEKADANGNLAGAEALVLFDGRIEPGEHLLEVELVCRGGSFGVFSYIQSYRFRVTSRYVMRVREGRTNRLEVVAYQRPDITLEAPERLSVRYDYEVLGGASTGADASRP